MILRLTIISLLLLGLLNATENKTAEKWEKFFTKNDVTGTIVLKDVKNAESLVYNKERSETQFIPASTFKILNAMIALQTKSIATVDDTIKWDGVERSYKPWNKDHTMRTGFPVSCVWLYQEFARRTGKEAMQKWISASNYGNMKIENDVDQFWLKGKLAISANEQIDFLEKLIKNELSFDTKIQETVKEIMISDSTENYVIHSKTGWAQKIGWFVGYIQTKDNTWIFSLNIDMPDIKMAGLRKSITYDVLKEQGIIE